MKARCQHRARHQPRMCREFTTRHWCPISCGVCQACSRAQLESDQRDHALTLEEWRDAAGLCKRNISHSGSPERGSSSSSCTRLCATGPAVPAIVVDHGLQGSRGGAAKGDEARTHDQQPTTISTHIARSISDPNEALVHHSDVVAPTMQRVPRHRLIGTRVVLGGGLNNMLMQVAELLSACCCSEDDDTALVLPRLDADPLRMSAPQESLPFRAVFNASAFVSGVRPCRAVEPSPSGPGAWDDKAGVALPASEYGVATTRSPLLQWIVPRPIRGRWNASAHLVRVYSAARPSVQVAALVEALETEAVRRAGPRWDAVHLTIERDWCAACCCAMDDPYPPARP